MSVAAVMAELGRVATDGCNSRWADQFHVQYMCSGSAPAREQVPDTPTETLSHFLNAVLIVTRRKSCMLHDTALGCAECGGECGPMSDVIRPAWLWPRRPGSVTQSGRGTERPAKLTVFHTVGDPPRNSITHIDIDHRLPVIDIVAESNTSRDATADATRGD